MKGIAARVSTVRTSQQDIDDVSTISSGETLPVWFMQTMLPALEPLTQDQSTQVVVVGAGIAGLTTAYFLAKSGRQVIVVEDGDVGSGETGRTTAHLFTALDERYYELQKSFGKDTTRLIAESHQKAIDAIEEIVKTENIDCEFSRVEGYLFLGGQTTQKELHQEYDACIDSGVPVQWVPSAPVFQTGEALQFHQQGQFHINKYLVGLTTACLKMGVKIYTQTHALDMIGGENAHVKTADGKIITCQHIVVATNVPVNDTVTMYLKLAAYRSYVITARIPKNSVPQCLWWDTNDPYTYTRTSSFDEESDVLIIGGEDHPCGRDHQFEQRYANLEKWARDRFPMMGEIITRWSGQICEPHDGVAFLGRNPGDQKNVYIISGDSGHGMTHATIGARLVTDLINDNANPYVSIYDPSRTMHRAIRETIMEDGATQKQYLDWLKPGDVKDIEDIRGGCGATIRSGLSKMAVYKDEDGTVHACSAVCPHLGGIVNWNDSEKSWDCPVHGSRFNRYGVPINGPSNVGLKVVSIK